MCLTSGVIGNAHFYCAWVVGIVGDWTESGPKEYHWSEKHGQARSERDRPPNARIMGLLALSNWSRNNCAYLREVNQPHFALSSPVSLDLLRLCCRVSRPQNFSTGVLSTFATFKSTLPVLPKHRHRLLIRGVMTRCSRNISTGIPMAARAM